MAGNANRRYHRTPYRRGAKQYVSYHAGGGGARRARAHHLGETLSERA